MDVGGQALWTFQRIGAWAVAGAGVLYEPARKARTATMTVEATADLRGTNRPMGSSWDVVVEAFAAPEKEWRESSQDARGCQGVPAV
jgi:hypothetical protein